MRRCMCGATDCPSCGPAQGYAVVKRWSYQRGCWEYVNPEDDELDFAEDYEEGGSDDEESHADGG